MAGGLVGENELTVGKDIHLSDCAKQRVDRASGQQPSQFPLQAPRLQKDVKSSPAALNFDLHT
jgi:hypothetical protein